MKRWAVALAALLAMVATPGQARDIVDALGRTSTIPDTVERVICSGSGALRLLSYLGGTDLVVGVDEIEKRNDLSDARPYFLANPQFRDLPLIGAHRGRDNFELIMALDPAPQVILKSVSSAGPDVPTTHERTQIPVIGIDTGDFGAKRPQLYQALRIMGEVIGRTERAEEVIAFFESEIADLEERADRSDIVPPTAFVGAVAHAGAQGFNSTEPNYPPFALLGIKNLAAEGAGAGANHAMVAKEKILEWDPEILFLDLSTLQGGATGGGLHELKTEPVYQALTAVAEQQVWGLLPYNLYSKNYGSILADAWFIGTLLRPDSFDDITPAAKADEIYEFLLGEPVFGQMDEMFEDLAFVKVPLQ